METVLIILVVLKLCGLISLSWLAIVGWVAGLFAAQVLVPYLVVLACRAGIIR